MYASMDGPKIAAQGNAYIHVDLDVSVMYVTSAANILYLSHDRKDRL